MVLKTKLKKTFLKKKIKMFLRVYLRKKFSRIALKKILTNFVEFILRNVLTYFLRRFLWIWPQDLFFNICDKYINCSSNSSTTCDKEHNLA